MQGVIEPASLQLHSFIAKVRSQSKMSTLEEPKQIIFDLVDPIGGVANNFQLNKLVGQVLVYVESQIE